MTITQRGPRVLVVAGTYQQFLRFKHEYDNSIELCYYEGPESSRGILWDDVIFFGTWFLRKDLDEANFAKADCLRRRKGAR